MPQKTPPENATHQKMPEPSYFAQKSTIPEVKKLDDSVEIRPKSPDVNLETRLDIKVARNTYRKKSKKAA
jgi:hypothetical protein